MFGVANTRVMFYHSQRPAADFLKCRWLSRCLREAPMLEIGHISNSRAVSSWELLSSLNDLGRQADACETTVIKSLLDPAL